MCVWAEGAFVGVGVCLRECPVCVSVVFVWKADCVVCESLCVCVRVCSCVGGVGVDCVSECEYVSPVKGQTRRIPP